MIKKVAQRDKKKAISKNILCDINTVINFEIMSMDDLKQFLAEIVDIVSNKFEKVHGRNCTDNAVDDEGALFDRKR